ncbi:MAG: alpha/beta hydrolase [Paracoccaceae bacterium]
MSRIVRAGGTQTGLRRWNAGASRQVWAVHCSLAHSGAWEGLAAHMPADIGLSAFDLPGHGRAAPWDPSRDFQDQALGMLEGLAGDDPVDLIGHSYGATVALRFALERPKSVRSLALIEPVLFKLAEVAAPEIYAAYRKDFAPFVEAIGRGECESAARVFTEIWGAGDDWNTISARTRQGLVERIGLILAGDSATFADRAGLSRPGRLEALDLPVLLVEGAASPPVIGAIQAELHRRLPGAARIVVDAARHMVPITHPGDVARGLIDLWGRAPVARPSAAG